MEWFLLISVITLGYLWGRQRVRIRSLTERVLELERRVDGR